MAYGSTALDAALEAYYNADYCMLLAYQRLEDIPSLLQWRQGGSWAAGADETHSDFPGFLARDRKAYAATKPDSNQLTWYFLFQWPDNALATIDAMVILGHNFGSNGATATLQIANGSDYTTDLIDLVTVTPADDDRIVQLVLDHANPTAPVDPTVYTNVKYGRVEITASNAFAPEFDELWVGERVQFSEPVLRGYSPVRSVSEFVGNRTVSGTTHRSVFNYGAKAPQPRIYLNDQDDVDAAEAFLAATRQGVDPFIFIPQPKSHPAFALLVTDESPGNPIDYVRGTENQQAGFFDISGIVENEPFVITEL